MGCFGGLARFLLFTFNIICFLAGLAMLILGIVYQVGFTDYIENLEELYSIVSLTPVLLIVVGAIVFAIAFFGCWGAWRKNSCMLITYAIILIIILVLQVAFVIYVLVKAKDDGLRENIEEALRELFSKNSHVATETFDFIQTQLECCGLDNSADWASVPATCCATETNVVNGVCLIPFQQGCLTALYDFITGSINVIGIVAACLAGVELIGAIMAICIANSSRKG